MQRKLLTLQEAAELLNASSAQVYALVRSGELPAMKMGGRGQWRVDPERLQDYIDRAHEKTAKWVSEHPLSVRDPSVHFEDA